MNEVIITGRVLSINPEGNVTIEIRTCNTPPAVLVMGRGATFRYYANIIDPEITDVEGAKLAIEKARQA